MVALASTYASHQFSCHGFMMPLCDHSDKCRPARPKIRVITLCSVLGVVQCTGGCPVHWKISSVQRGLSSAFEDITSALGDVTSTLGISLVHWGISLAHWGISLVHWGISQVHLGISPVN